MKYEFDTQLQKRADWVAHALGYSHIDMGRVACVRSRGTKTKRTIARVHGLSKALQVAMGEKPFYVIEFLSEKFDKLSESEQTTTIIHELMHIPRSFGGGFRSHRGYVTKRMVEAEHRRFLDASRTSSE